MLGMQDSLLPNTYAPHPTKLLPLVQVLGSVSCEQWELPRRETCNQHHALCEAVF